AEIKLVVSAIAAHNTDGINRNGLIYLLYKADKLSRNCFDCSMYSECYWDEAAQSSEIII
ncbi:MAG: HD domain-containing protein, partial [Coprococcus sp.]